MADLSEEYVKECKRTFRIFTEKLDRSVELAENASEIAMYQLKVIVELMELAMAAGVDQVEIKKAILRAAVKDQR